ncbi:hypothetical protein AMTRI_Chr11g151640 [Amborella trichopoda]
MDPHSLLFSFALMVFSFIISALLYVLSSRRTLRAIQKIPGSLGWPIIGESLSFMAEFSTPSGIHAFIQKRQQRYGKVFKTSILGRLTVFMTGREASKILLSGKDGLVSLNLFYTGKQVMGPTSLLQTTGEEHKRLRRLIGEPLCLDALKKYLPFIDSLASDTLDQWAGRTVFVLEEASSFTLKVIGHIIMSLESHGEEQENFRNNFKTISSAFATLPLKIPGFAFYKGIKARDRMYSMLDIIIHKRRSGEKISDDFLQSLITNYSTRTEEDRLTDSQLKDNILTLLIAGHDTTTAALTWVIKFLEENPIALQKVREEHQQIWERRRDGIPQLSWSEVNNMPYTNKVINETLRIATILPWNSRKAAQDFEIDGYEIKKGWSINLDVVSVHHDPNLFMDPEKFDPSRFDKSLKPFSFLGFGGGPRMCPGINLARLEISVFIHQLLCRYKWKPLSRDNSLHPTLVRMPKSKYPIVVEACCLPHNHNPEGKQ